MRPKTTIFAVAEKAFTPQNQINGSGFVRDVAHLLGEPLPDEDADHLIRMMQSSPSCYQLGNNDLEASKLAGQHDLVIAGWLNPHGHGHLVVIVPGRENGYAKGYWGSLGHAGDAGENKGINWAFGPHERGQVEYFALPVGTLAPSS